MNRGSACDGWAPVMLSKRAFDAMTDADKRAVAHHNEHGERVCGWSPPQ